MNGNFWFELFERRGTRRDFLRLGAGAAGVVALGGLPGCGAGRAFRASTRPFSLGVASGDPTPDGVVLWTRLDAMALEASGVHRDPVEIRWELAEDEGLRRIVRTGTVDARPELGHSAHVELAGLRPGRDYFYRFLAGGDSSAVGRTRTAPAPGADNQRLDFAFLSCQHYEHGYYTALRHLAGERLDLVVHLGDYIYEGAPLPRGVRSHEGPGETVDLQGYRARYTTYRADPELQMAHAAAPWLVTFDDHEVDNDWAGDVPQDDQTPEAFLLRRAAAFQVFYEFMPLRRASMPAGPSMQAYRRLRFGTLLEMSLLDTRQYRSDQPCGRNIAPSCAEHRAPGRTLLGPRQKGWLMDGLGDADTRWNVLAQQVLMARFRDVREGEEVWSMDKWDGYPLERAEVLAALADSGVPNPVVLTGDIHSSWVTRLLRDFDDERSPTVATELVGTSVTSNGDGQAMTTWGEAALRHNPWVDFYDARRGYVHCTVTPERLSAHYRMVPYVQRRGAPLETLETFVVENGQPGAVRG